MKIAIFEPRYLTPKAFSPSYMIILKKQVEWFAKLGNEVSIFAEGPEFLKLGPNTNLCSIRTLASVGQSLSDRKVISYLSGIFSPEMISKTVKALRGSDVDVIYSCGTSFSALFTGILSKLTAIPSVHYVFEYSSAWRWWRGDEETFTGYEIPLSYKIKQFFNTLPRELPRREFIHRWGLRNTRLIASSLYVREKLEKAELISDIPVVYPCVDLPQEIPEHKNNQSSITYMGHLWQGRGVLDLVSAFSRVAKTHPQINLKIAQSNIHELTEHYFENLVEKFQLRSRVQRIGVVKDVNRELIFPSVAIALPYRDTPSIKLLEAMACGKPIVTTKLKWVQEIINDEENGFLADVGDVHGIASKLEKLIENYDLAVKVGQNARKTISELCACEHNCRDILNILTEAKYSSVKLEGK